MRFMTKSKVIRFVVCPGLSEVFMALAGCSSFEGHQAADTGWIKQYNVVWDSASSNALDSMPLSGSRGAGANLWVQDGSVWLYLAHNGAYDENEDLLKLGCLRVTPAGLDLRSPKSFCQELDLATGSVRVDVTASDGTMLGFRLWFSDETLLIESQSSRPLTLEVAFSSWRAKPEPAGPEKVIEDNGSLLLVHRNNGSPFALAMAKAQHVPLKDLVNPAADRVFGCAVIARGGLSFTPPAPVKYYTWEGYEWPAKTTEAKEHLIAVTLGAAKKAEPASWLTQARSMLIPDALRKAREAAGSRWTDFWNRSHIVVKPGKTPADPVFQMGRNYQLFRYMLACNQGGELPLKFNGGIFTVGPQGERVPKRLNAGSEIPTGGNPDYRRWGTMFMSQNQRWLGWPTLANGDADLMAVSAAFYRDRLSVAQARARNLGADGAVYVEPLSLGGMCIVAGNESGTCNAPHLRQHFSMGLEHAWMTLQAHSVLGLDINVDLPWMVQQARFFDSFYRARTKERTGSEWDSNGRLLLYPCSGLELVGGGTNPIETVAGLRRVVEGLLALPELPDGDRKFLEQLQPRLPDLPMTERNGKKILAIADNWEKLYNGWELPELYAAWPYCFVGVTQPETLSLARATWDAQEYRGDGPKGVALQRKDFSWMPTWVDMAELGLTEEAATRGIAKLSDQASCCRFPAFFGPGHDWMPDHNWGGSAMVGLQGMLLAAEPGPSGKLLLFPAWPREWDVDFKLHAPGQTVVEGVLRGGELVSLKVTPDSRAKDVVNCLGQFSGK